MGQSPLSGQFSCPGWHFWPVGAWIISPKHKDRWFRRIIAVEGVFLLLFTEWYFSRYLLIGPNLGFTVTVALIAGISLLILVGGVVRDRLEHKRALTD